MLELMYTIQIFQNFRIWCDDMPTAVPVYSHCLGFCFSQSLPPPPLPLPGGGGAVMNVNTGCTV